MTENSSSESYADYLIKATRAREDGDLVLGMHLYLAAYERAIADPEIADGMALEGLREAWNLACELKERSMAEYVFERLEPYLSGDEIARCANELQKLALDRLEEYGFSREELQGMAEMISQDFMEGEGALVKVESISLPHVPVVMARSEDPFEPEVSASAESRQEGKPNKIEMGVADADFNPYDEFDTSSVGKSYHAATNDGSNAYTFTRDVDRAAESENARQVAAEAAGAQQGKPDSLQRSASESSKAADTSSAPASAPVPASVSIPMMPEVPPAGAAPLSYRTLAGYEGTVSAMRDLGIGLQRDPGFRNFVSMLNSRHGLERMPALDTLLFRSPAVEDATRFVDATIGELGLPVLRMSMEEGPQGMPVLCVATQGDARPRMNHAHNRFDGPGILVIDDLDMWAMPQPPEGVEGIAGFVMANMSRGAREAVNLISSAVEDPEVFVLVTASTQGDPDPFFCELLEPVSVIDIPYPDERERTEIWNEIMRDHPSMRLLNRDDLLRFSAGIARYDIYMAARSALEEAYKAGLAQRMYLPVTAENMLEKLAACQPLESDEYRAIEEAVVSSFRDGLDDLEDLVDGPLG